MGTGHGKEEESTSTSAWYAWTASKEEWRQEHASSRSPCAVDTCTTPAASQSGCSDQITGAWCAVKIWSCMHGRCDVVGAECAEEAETLSRASDDVRRCTRRIPIPISLHHIVFGFGGHPWDPLRVISSSGRPPTTFKKDRYSYFIYIIGGFTLDDLITLGLHEIFRLKR